MKFNTLHQIQANIRLKINNLRSLGIQSTTLKLVALGLAALLGVLVLGGIQAIARVDGAPAKAESEFVSHPIPANPLSALSSPQPSSPSPQVPFQSDFSSPRFSMARASQTPSPPVPQSAPQIAPQPAKEAHEVNRPNRVTPNRVTPNSGRPAASPAPAPAPAAQPPRPPAQPARPATSAPPRPVQPARPAPITTTPTPTTAPALAPITPVFTAPNPALSDRMPAMANAPADPSNFGDRYATDIYGRPVSNKLLVVLHETVGTASSAVNTMQTPHPNEDDQVSYHSIVKRDGTVLYVVAPEKRAFGAGNSVFNGANGPEAVKTHKDFPPSVNNFAYHISLESPNDGFGSSQTHSGYTTEQYKSIAWLIAWTNVPYDRVTTHRAVDQSGSRIDPRSFDGQLLAAQLQPYMRETAQQ